MARQEKNREDLMAEAGNLVERCELRLPDLPIVVAGFRRDGCFSVYFDQDPVYHLDAAGRLRRGFVAGSIYKAEKGRLVQLTRTRTPEAVHLVRHEMSDEETAAWLGEATEQIAAINRRLMAGRYEVERCVPEDVDVPARLRVYLDRLKESLLAVAPNVRATG